MSKKLSIFLRKIRLGEENPACFSLFLSCLSYCVLCCHLASFPRCPRESAAFLLLKTSQNGKTLVISFCKEVGIGTGVSLCRSSCKTRGPSFLLQLSRGSPPSPLALESLSASLPSACARFFFQWQLLYVCTHKGPRMSFRLFSDLLL